ncbi:MAG TPA: hypothetical protein VMY37_41250 [Thermoguttaceae bacterium]|nr:hypothetical protein [Thermoguttaceae bacterium]
MDEPLMCDLTGDIRGHADELLQLPELLGYDRRRGYRWDGEQQLSDEKFVYVKSAAVRRPRESA